MFNKKLVVLAVIGLLSAMQANAVSWQWVRTAGAGADVRARMVAVDLSDNIYTTGVFNASITLGTTTLTSSGNNDVFIVKHDQTGTVVWAKKFGSAFSDQADAIATDNEGNIYILGYTWSRVIVGADTATYGFFAKMNPQGVMQWVKPVDVGAGYDIAVDGNKNIYVAGTLNGSFTYGGTTLTSKGFEDAFVAKYNTSGALQWARSGGSKGTDYSTGVSVDKDGNVYLCGTLDTTATFETQTLTQIGSNGYSDIFVAKYGPTGALAWAKINGGAGTDAAQAVTVDSTGNVWVAGSLDFQGIDSIAFGAASATCKNCMYQAFVAKYSSAGVPELVRQFGNESGGTQEIKDVTTSADGSIVITGSLSAGSYSFGPNSMNMTGAFKDGFEGVFIGAFSAAGAALWGQLGYASSESVQGQGVATDSKNNVFVCGGFGADTIGFGTIITKRLSANGDRDMFLAKYGSLSSAARDNNRIATAHGALKTRVAGANLLVTLPASASKSQALQGRLVSVNGATVASGSFAAGNTATLSLRKIASGMYFVETKLDNGMTLKSQFLYNGRN